jgi:hypothetical protein
MVASIFKLLDGIMTTSSSRSLKHICTRELSRQWTIAPTATEGRRNFRYQSPHAVAEIVAPNGARVAVLELDEDDQEIEVAKNQPSTHGLLLGAKGFVSHRDYQHDVSPR